MGVISKPIISADSHITEPRDVYVGRLSQKYQAIAPRMVRRPEGGDVFVIEGMPEPFPINVAAGAGLKGQAILAQALVNFEDCLRGGWDPKQRLLDQDLDGIAAEILYPSLGLVLCNHPDPDYKAACFKAYNEWLSEFCAVDPSRLIGVGQTAMTSPEDGVRDLEAMKDQGLRGAMMPGFPVIEDYDSPIYDPFWEAAIDLKMPLSFHILTYKEGTGKWRGPRQNRFMGTIRGNQDIIGALIFSGVFDRHPDLKIVCAEGDAGWAPHYMYRMDHALDRIPHRPGEAKLSRQPSEYFFDNVYLTFQDDLIAFKFKDSLNGERIMWANDFPHMDSTWPHSQDLLQRHTGSLSEGEKERLLHDNVSTLYNIGI